MKNYYEILEVHYKASMDIIQKVYKIKIKKMHPDLFDNDDEKKKADENIKLLNEAYEILSDDKKRKDYDFDLNVENNEEVEILKKKIKAQSDMIKYFYPNFDEDFDLVIDEHKIKFAEDKSTKNFTPSTDNFSYLFKILILIVISVLVMLLILLVIKEYI